MSHINATNLTPSRQLANTLATLQTILSSPTLQPLASTDNTPAVQQVLDSCYAQLRLAVLRNMGPDWRDTSARPDTVAEFMAEALADCDASLAYLATLTGHQGWAPAPAIFDTGTQAAIEALLLSGMEGKEGPVLTHQMDMTRAQLPTKHDLLWMRQALYCITKALRLATGDYDRDQDRKVIHDPPMKSLAAIVLPLMTGKHFSLAVVAAHNVAWHTRTGGETPLIIGVNPHGLGVTTYSPTGFMEDPAYEAMAACNPILLCCGQDWKQIDFREVRRLHEAAEHAADAAGF